MFLGLWPRGTEALLTLSAALPPASRVCTGHCQQLQRELPQQSHTMQIRGCSSNDSWDLPELNTVPSGCTAGAKKRYPGRCQPFAPCQGQLRTKSPGFGHHPPSALPSQGQGQPSLEPGSGFDSGAVARIARLGTKGPAGAQWEGAGAVLCRPPQTLHGPKLSQKLKAALGTARGA